VAEATADDPALGAELRRLLTQDAAAATGDAAVRDAIGRAAARLVSERQDRRLGERLGPWRIVAHLADGGMGAVYRGVRDDGRYVQQVAVKLLNPAFASADAKARLETERRILARLEHPAIARLLDGGSTDDGVPYLVMEFVDGEPIDTWCDQQGLDTAARLRLFVQVCRAVDHAHRNLVVHRDLKPSNILVDTEGRPRLLDFGIAKLVDGAPGVTRTGEVVLTPSHASPEQITGGTVTTATDVYALGVLLYDLLTGRLPYGGAGTPAAALAREIVETEPPRPSAAVTDGGSSRRLAAARARGERLTPQRLAQELSGDLDNIVLMALRKEPDRRYPTAADLADDIERSLADLPVRARRDTLGYRATKFLRRHPVAVPVSALAHCWPSALPVSSPGGSLPGARPRAGRRGARHARGRVHGVGAAQHGCRPGSRPQRAGADPARARCCARGRRTGRRPGGGDPAAHRAGRRHDELGRLRRGPSPASRRRWPRPDHAVLKANATPPRRCSCSVSSRMIKASLKSRCTGRSRPRRCSAASARRPNRPARSATWRCRSTPCAGATKPSRCSGKPCA
jgi:serine/threonine protein kinase